MRYSLINPPWSFEGSIYFGCREPHLPLELGYSKKLLKRAGHEVQLIDAQLKGLDVTDVRCQLKQFRPDLTVVTTAPSYLFWRCAPPELRVPLQLIEHIRDVAGKLVAIGPHGSTTPTSTLRKLGVDAVVIGECEEVLPQLAGDWAHATSIAYREGHRVRVQGTPHASSMEDLPALTWDAPTILSHKHHHHRFDAPAAGPGAEMETSRGCPYHCTFCAKDNFRNSFRRRPLETITSELDHLKEQGVEYVYFIDEIFLPHSRVLQAIAERRIKFGIQTRIDLWNHDSIRLLGEAGCVSVEAGVESITEKGRERLAKNCKLSTEEISSRLMYAKDHIPFVQANLLNSEDDDPMAVGAWRADLLRRGVWANQPVPLFCYPGSPDYSLRWGAPDDQAWERAHEHYLRQFDEFSDIQEQQPLQLIQLETTTEPHA
jgi:anaerobic magnesium-protoporphyrin IX monomethyl ester cyclase